MINPFTHAEGGKISGHRNALDFGARSVVMASLGTFAGWKFGWWSKQRGVYLGVITNVTDVLSRRVFSNCWSERSDETFAWWHIIDPPPQATWGWSVKCLSVYGITSFISGKIVSYRLTSEQYKRLYFSNLAVRIVEKIFV